MFRTFIFFSSVYSADFSTAYPTIKISHKSQIPPLSKQFQNSETFKKYKGVTFWINGEKTTVDFPLDI